MSDELKNQDKETAYLIDTKNHKNEENINESIDELTSVKTAFKIIKTMVNKHI